MLLINYDILLSVYSTKQIYEDIEMLNKFDLFHCLLAGGINRANAVKQYAPGLPLDFLSWLEVCDGGMLFDTTMLTTKSYDADLDLEFETYGDFYNPKIRQSVNLPDDWFIFAITVHQGVYFFDLRKNDGKVYQWDVEEQEIYAEWETFDNWLRDQIHEAVGLISDDLLKPNVIKTELIAHG